MSMDDTLNKLPPRRRTLGKGLGALLGEAAEDYAQLDGTRPTKTVPVEMMAPSPFQPRRHFDEAALADLAQSIREKGIIQPILLRRDPAQPNHYQIIAGERRWRAAQQAGLIEVPVIIREFSDSEALEVAIIENVQREDLNVMEESLGYERLIKEYSHTQEEVARLVGKSRAHIANTLRLLRLPPQAQAALSDGRLTAGHARALLSAVDARDDGLFIKIMEDGLTVREAEDYARNARHRAAQEGLKEPETPRSTQVRIRDANTLALEEAVSAALGLTVSISGKGQKGTLMIKYQNLDQLDDLLKKLCGEEMRV